MNNNNVLMILERSGSNLEVNKSNNEYVLEGIFAQFGVENNNHRIYEMSLRFPLKHPQERVLLFVRLLNRTCVSFPQAQTHRHIISRLYFPHGSITVRFPNVFPDILLISDIMLSRSVSDRLLEVKWHIRRRDSFEAHIRIIDTIEVSLSTPP